MAKQAGGNFFDWLADKQKFEELKKRLPIDEYICCCLTSISLSKYSLPRKTYGEGAESFGYGDMHTAKGDYRFKRIFN